MRRVLATFIFLTGLVFVTLNTVSGASHLVLIARGRTEPSMAVDPRRPSTIVIGTNTNYGVPQDGAYPVGYFASADGGRTFIAGNAPVIAPYTTQADPTVVIDRHGTVFFSYLGESPGYCQNGHSAVTIAHSIDGGQSFRGARIVDTAGADDKPNLAVRSGVHGPSLLFLTWSRFHDASNSTDVWFARSIDGGATFSRPVLLETSRGSNVGTVPVVAPSGRIYVFWDHFSDRPDQRAGSARILFRMSSDNGRHFSGERSAGFDFTQVPLVAAPFALRNLTAPAVLADKSGTLYLSWPAVVRVFSNGSVSNDILLSRSTNGGATWTRPVAVNDAHQGDRFMPAMTRLSDGSLAIMYYDRRRGSANLDVYAVRVRYRQGWRLSHTIRVDPGVSAVADIQYIPPTSTCFIPGRFFGDYLGIAPAAGGRVDLSWTDTALHVQDETDVWFTQLAFPVANHIPLE